MTKNIFSALFAYIVNCYDNSRFEKVMSAIFGFFGKRLSGSAILGYFKNNFSNGAVWNKSLAHRAVNAPFEACLRIRSKNWERTERAKSKSAAYSFMKNAGNVSLRDFGRLLLSLAAGLALGSAIFGKTDDIINAAVTLATLFAGLFLYCFRGGFNEVKTGSVAVKLIRKAFDDETLIRSVTPETVKIKHIRPLCILAFASGGLLFANAPSEACVGVCVAGAAVAILYDTKIGVYLFAPFAALMPTMAAAALVLLTFVSFVLHLMFDEKAEYVSTPFQPFIALFLGLAVFSAVTGAAPLSSMKILTLYFTFTLGFVLVVNTVKTRKDWTILVVLCVLAAALVALYGVYQNFFGAASARSWVDEKMFTDIKTRVYSTLDNPNVLGEYLIMLMPVAAAVFVSAKGSLQKTLYAACNLVMLACLMYTWSRGAWIGVVIGIAFFALLKDRRWLVACVAVLLLMPSVLPESILSRITSIGNTKDSSTSYRVAIWTGSVRMLKDYWFCGIGLGPDAFLKIYPRYALGGADFALHSHNFYLQWIADMGFMGIVVYFGIILTGLKRIASVSEKNTMIKNVMLAATGAIFGYLFHGMAENLWYNYRMILIFWVYFGIIQSGAAIAERGDKKAGMTGGSI